ncbi:MAG: glycosyl transferase family 2 [Burkholderiales bacterium]|nr:glycosyl transferase family 2 [Burkholderiales bacterium]
MINIVVPMAGKGSRFINNGYNLPKPMLIVQGHPMIEVVIENLRPSCPHRFIFICQKDHLDNFNLRPILKKHAGDNTEIITIDYMTEGAACTVLLAEKFIKNNDPLMIANCDQFTSISINNYLNNFDNSTFDGFIMTMTANDPKWSFVRLNNVGEVIEVVEKQVVSTEATVGIYNYKHGYYFVQAAKDMIASNDRVNNEFYVAPAYNYMLKKNYRIGFMNVGNERSGVYGLGIPDDLTYFNTLDKLPRK